jgi:hypothetical protein
MVEICRAGPPPAVLTIADALIERAPSNGPASLNVVARMQ